MTESSTKSYHIENHCFTTAILEVFPLHGNQKTTFGHNFYVFILSEINDNFFIQHYSQRLNLNRNGPYPVYPFAI